MAVTEKVKKIKKKGYKLTPQRRKIYACLESAEGHLSAEEIRKGVSKDDPKIGLATVYRTLELLVKLGLVREEKLGEGHRHFELARKPHYHLICSKCGKVFEFSENLTKDLAVRLSNDYKFNIVECRLDFYGYCEKCSQKAVQKSQYK